jgi:hypothetical protein
MPHTTPLTQPTPRARLLQEALEAGQASEGDEPLQVLVQNQALGGAARRVVERDLLRVRHQALVRSPAWCWCARF